MGKEPRTHVETKSTSTPPLVTRYNVVSGSYHNYHMCVEQKYMLSAKMDSSSQRYTSGCNRPSKGELARSITIEQTYVLSIIENWILAYYLGPHGLNDVWWCSDVSENREGRKMILCSVVNGNSDGVLMLEFFIFFTLRI